LRNRILSEEEEDEETGLVVIN